MKAIRKKTGKKAGKKAGEKKSRGSANRRGKGPSRSGAIAKNLRALPGGGNGGSQSWKELLFLRDVSEFADELLEECARERRSLRTTLERFLPAVAQKLGAVAALVRTPDEDLSVQTFSSGAWPDADRTRFAEPDPAKPVARSGDGKRTVVAQPLDVAGTKVGAIAFAFAGDRTGDGTLLGRRVNAAAEELDGVLAAIQLAALKQDLILRVQQSLKNLVFERGVDDAVAVLHGALPLRDLVLVYHDDAALTQHAAIRYRVYRDGVCTADSESQPHARLSEAVAHDGQALLTGDGSRLQAALGLASTVENVLISGLTSARVLGKISVTAPGGLSTFARDLLRVFAECISQRLVDYNRERRHLSQFFSPSVISELLRDPAYEERWLAPRTDEVAILYADINSFTKISEQVLLDPGKIGRFVDRWSEGAVEILWKHGGVFDKMVGDCVIGLFGPPFFRSDRVGRIASAVKAAREILSFTIGLEHDPDLASVVSSGIVPGLGVAVGINLCPASVGLFGPNQDFTAFSSGMNQTARLQSLAGFREILVMDSARDSLVQSQDAALRDVTYDGPAESPVKNVAKPLRFYRVKLPEMKKK